MSNTKIKAIIWYNTDAIISAGGKLQGVQTYHGNASRKSDTQRAFDYDLQRLQKLIEDRKGKFKAAAIYDMRGASSPTSGTPLYTYNSNGERL